MVSSSILVSTILLVFFSRTILCSDQRNVTALLHDCYEKQIQMEFFASNVYLTFAHRLAYDGVYHGFADFFFESAEEERDHGKKFLDFHNVRNHVSHLRDITITEELASTATVNEMLRKAKTLEDDVFNNMRMLHGYAVEAGHSETVHFIEKVTLEEQTIAVKQMHDLVKRLDHNNNSPILLQMMDQDLRKKKVKQP